MRKLQFDTRPLQHSSQVFNAWRFGPEPDVDVLSSSSPLYHGPKRHAQKPPAARITMQKRHASIEQHPILFLYFCVRIKKMCCCLVMQFAAALLLLLIKMLCSNGNPR